MTRQTHDIVNDHFGVLDAAQLAGGTATSGYAPISNGDGTSTWGPAGGSSIHMANDDTTFSANAVTFADGAEILANDGATATVFTYLRLSDTNAYLHAQSASGTYSEINANYNGDMIITGTNGTAENLIEILNTPYVAITSFSVAGSFSDPYAQVFVASNGGSIEMYTSGPVFIDPDGYIEMYAGGNIDMSGTGGVLFPPKHAADPTGVEGAVYYNTATHKLRVYNGTTWQDCN